MCLKVIKIIHLNNNKVKLFLSNKKVYLLLKSSLNEFDLFEGKKISDKDIGLIIKQANFLSIYEKSLKFLSNREHSYFELKIKLNKKFKDIEQIEKCLNEIVRKNFQSDERFTKNFINLRLNKKNLGPFRIIEELRIKGISPEYSKKIIEETVDNNFWERKIKDTINNFSKYNKDFSFRTLGQKLYRQGFPYDMIVKTLNNYGSTNENLN